LPWLQDNSLPGIATSIFHNRTLNCSDPEVAKINQQLPKVTLIELQDLDNFERINESVSICAAVNKLNSYLVKLNKINKERKTFVQIYFDYFSDFLSKFLFIN